MLHKFLSILAVSALGVSWSVCAQIHNPTDTVSDISGKTLVDQHIADRVKSSKIVFIDGKPAPAEAQRQIDSIRKRISEFYYDQFRHFSDPEAPYFLFMSKDAQLAMGIGGAVRMRAYYDWGGAMPVSGFYPYLIPMKPNPTNMRHFDTTPSGTCLYFRVIGRNKTLGDYQLYIETDFTGYEGRDFKLKKAYAIINNFTVGYAPSTFSDPSALPPTVDAAGPNNKITPTSVLVRYMPKFRNRWYLGLSIETPSSAIDIDNVSTAKVSNWLPDFAALVQYEWAAGQHVRFSGIIRTLPYRNLITQTNHNCVGWGLMLSEVSRPASMLTTYATVSYGKGYAGLGGDLLMGNYDLISESSNPGKMYAPGMLGCCVGLQYNIRSNLFVSLSGSMTRYYPDNNEKFDTEYKQGLWGAANIFWYMTPRMMLAAEFDLGRRENFDGESRWARRVGAVCQFSF